MRREHTRHARLSTRVYTPKHPRSEQAKQFGFHEKPIKVAPSRKMGPRWEKSARWAAGQTAGRTRKHLGVYNVRLLRWWPCPIVFRALWLLPFREERWCASPLTFACPRAFRRDYLPFDKGYLGGVCLTGRRLGSKFLGNVLRVDGCEGIGNAWVRSGLLAVVNIAKWSFFFVCVLFLPSGLLLLEFEMLYFRVGIK